jgi:hypothetical protein
MNRMEMIARGGLNAVDQLSSEIELSAAMIGSKQ